MWELLLTKEFWIGISSLVSVLALYFMQKFAESQKEKRILEERFAKNEEISKLEMEETRRINDQIRRQNGHKE